MTSTETRDYTAEMFSGEQIATAISQLGDYERYADVATLSAGEYEPETIEAFAKLARTLKAPVLLSSYRFVIRRELSLETRRATALRNLQAQAERGEIEPAYLADSNNEEN
jgi:hypothetical protein